MSSLRSKYLLIAYKPDSNDYCRGCHMQSYSSDFIHYESDSRENIIQELAACFAFERGCNEDGYEEIHVYATSEKEVEEIYEAARTRSEEIIVERKEEELKKTAKRKAEDAQSEIKQRKSEYERLKKEFGNE